MINMMIKNNILGHKNTAQTCKTSFPTYAVPPTQSSSQQRHSEVPHISSVVLGSHCQVLIFLEGRIYFTCSIISLRYIFILKVCCEVKGET